MSENQRPGDWPSPDAGPSPRYTPQEGYTPPPNSYNYFTNSERLESASLGTRFVAFIIDSMLVGIPAGIVNGLFAAIFSLAGLAFWNWNLGVFNVQAGSGFTALFWGIYAYLCYVYFGGNTLGRKIMGVKLANEDGSKPTPTTFILYFSIGYLLNGLIFGVGFLWALWDPAQQTWGQKLFRTRTVLGNW